MDFPGLIKKIKEDLENRLVEKSKQPAFTDYW